MGELDRETEGVLKSSYSKLTAIREPFLRRARECAKVTIPTLMPPSTTTRATKLKTPFSGIGARAINNLSAKLLLALLPPNGPFFRLSVGQFDLEKAVQSVALKLAQAQGIDPAQAIQQLSEQAFAEIEANLAAIERAVMKEVDSLQLRVTAYEVLRQLVGCGNALFYLPPEGGKSRVFRLDRYVVRRDPDGTVLEIITEEGVAAASLTPDVREKCGIDTDSESAEKHYHIYTQVLRTDAGWEVKQELNGVEIPESIGTYPIDRCPWLALRWSKLDNEDYGRGYVEEYLGDFITSEGLTTSIVEGSAAAARVLVLVKPNGSTKIASISQAPNGAVREGDVNEVGFLQMQKFNDFRVAQETRNGVIQEISYAFLMNSAIQRNAERVTAEEIRLMAQELETVLGGIYSLMAEDFQLPLVSLIMWRMEGEGRLPAMPQNLVKPSILTGVEALGRASDLMKLNQFMQQLSVLGPDAITTYLRVPAYIGRVGASLGIETKGLLKSEEEVQAQQQAAAEAAQEAEMSKQAIGPAVKGVADISKAAITNPNQETIE